MTAHRSMAKLKPSGVAWLGEVPAHWEIKPLWAMYRPKKETGHPTETLLSVYRDHGVIEKSSRQDNKNRESEDLSGYQLVVNGDLVTNKMKAWQGSIAVSSLRGIVSPAYYVYRKLHTENDAYLHHLFRSTPYITGYQSASKGIRVGQWDLEADKFRLFPVLIPPINEQEAIVAHLGQVTTRIDALIAKKTRFIELLCEKRQALITHSVTKGLNADAPMKDSAVAWLGRIPAHWGVIQSRRLFSERNQKASEWERQLTVSQKYGLIAQTEFMELEGRRVVQVLRGHDILKYVEAGDFVISMRSFQGGLELSHLSGSISSAYVALTPIKWVENRYFRHLFKSSTYIQALQSTSDLVRDGQALRFENFSKVALPIVPLEEQRAIAAYLDRATERIDELVAKTKRSIELLREHRTALITAAVTGKIDLREAA